MHYFYLFVSAGYFDFGADNGNFLDLSKKQHWISHQFLLEEFTKIIGIVKLS